MKSKHPFLWLVFAIERPALQIAHGVLPIRKKNAEMTLETYLKTEEATEMASKTPPRRGRLRSPTPCRILTVIAGRLSCLKRGLFLHIICPPQSCSFLRVEDRALSGPRQRCGNSLICFRPLIFLYLTNVLAVPNQTSPRYPKPLGYLEKTAMSPSGYRNTGFLPRLAYNVMLGPLTLTLHIQRIYL